MGWRWRSVNWTDSNWQTQNSTAKRMAMRSVMC
jgi:hypothetical protein